MQFSSSPLLLAAIALLSASGSVARDAAVPGTYGCSDGYCWGSCIADIWANPGSPWKDSGDWCWTARVAGDKGQGMGDFVDCESDECTLDNGYECGASEDKCQHEDV